MQQSTVDPFIASDSRQFPLPPNKIALALAIGYFILHVMWHIKNPTRQSLVRGSARGGRGRRLDDEMAKPLKSPTSDPFITAEKDNSSYRRPTFFFTKKKIVGKKEKNILACCFYYKLFVYLPLQNLTNHKFDFTVLYIKGNFWKEKYFI